MTCFTETIQDSYPTHIRFEFYSKKIISDSSINRFGYGHLFGDSITEESFVDGGWGASLANHFCRTMDVVLRGYSGYNTRWALKVVEKVFPPPSDSGGAPMAVTVFFGANDACLPDRYGGFQHVPVHEYRKNLHAIVAYLKKQWSSVRILLITPPPIDEDGRLENPFVENKSGLPERTNEAAGQYAKACLAVAEECGIPSVDLWTKMQQIPGWQKAYLRDGLHLTQGGQQVVFEEIIATLKGVGLSLEKLPIDLPLMAEIDPKDPMKSF